MGPLLAFSRGVDKLNTAVGKIADSIGGPQVELAQMQPVERVGGQLAALVVPDAG